MFYNLKGAAMFECPTKEEIHNWLNDELDDQVCQRIESHVSACQACKQFLTILSSAELTAVADLQDVPRPSQDFLERVCLAVPSFSETLQLPVLPKYQVLRFLGKGAMGVVFLAKQEGLDRLVALKMIRADYFPDTEERKRFQREAEVIARAKHPNIVQIMEYGEHDSGPYFIMEFVEGGTLRQWLQGNPQAPEFAARLTEVLARALHHAHRQGIVHRDFKPANVLLDSSTMDGDLAKEEAKPTLPWIPKISDFGLAMRVGDSSHLTQTGQCIGTPSYMAPEQAIGNAWETSAATDVYALGATLYEMLTGRPPFNAETPLKTMKQVVDEDPVPPTRFEAGLPRDLETICLKCLNKNPQARYASASNFADDLKRFLVGEPIHARPVSWRERSVKLIKRHPTVSVLLAALLLLLLTGSGVSTYFALDATEQAEQSRTNETAAVMAKNKLEQTNRELVTSRDHAETVLARSLLRPFRIRSLQTGYPILPLSEPELSALWELAENRGETLWYRFVEEALRDSLTVRQLKNRAAFALHAAAGLDRDKRNLLEKLLIPLLRDGKLAEMQRADLALIAASLDNVSRPGAKLVSKTIQDALERTKDPLVLRELAEGLANIGPALDTNDAAQSCGQAATTLIQAILTSNNMYDVQILAYALEAIAPQLESKNAARLAELLLPALLSKGSNPGWAEYLAHGIVAVTLCMDPKESASVLTRAMSHVDDSRAVGELAKGLAAVASKIEPTDAVQVADTLAHTLIKEPNPLTYWQLGEALRSVARQLRPNDATQLSTTLSRAMEETNDSSLLKELAEVLVEVWVRMDSREAIRSRMNAAKLLSWVITKTSNASDMGEIGEGIAAVAASMDRDKTKQICVQTAVTLSKTMESTKKAIELFRLAKGIAATADSVDSKDISPSVARAVTVLSQAMGRTNDVVDLGTLAIGLNTLAARAELKDIDRTCAQAIEYLVNALRNDLSIYSYTLAEGIAALAVHLKPDIGMAILCEAMTRTTKPNRLRIYAKGVAAVAHRMKQTDAAQNCAHAMAIVTAAMNPSDSDLDITDIAEALAVLAIGMRSDHAAVCLIEAMAQTRQPDALRELSQGLSRVLSNDDLPCRSMATIAITSSAHLMGSGLTLPIPLVFVIERSPCRFTSDELVDLLNMPTCVDKARRTILDQLEHRYRRNFSNHWEFVQFAANEGLRFDFRGSPRRLLTKTPKVSS